MNEDEVVTVLVIDDERVIRESIASYLTKLNYKVVLAESGEEGIERFHACCPDLVLCDVDLPGMGGYEALKSILHQNPEQPVILLVPLEQSSKVVNAMRLGLSDYLLKPIPKMEMLSLAITNSLNRSRLIAQNNRYRQKLEVINRELEERVEIFHHDQQAGRHVQMSILPSSPQNLFNYNFAHCIIPSLYLSGDSVDYKPLSKNRVMFYIADVSGHGSSSAFVTVLLRFRIEQMRREYIRNRFTGNFSPARILQALNMDMLHSGLDKHITLFMGIINQNSNTLTYSVAGHYPMPILFEDSKARYLGVQKSSFPIGLFEEADYFQEKVKVDHPFSLTLFSDGILEALDVQNIQDKEGYLLDIISKCGGDHSRIISCLNLENLHNVPDDIAMMSVAG